MSEAPEKDAPGGSRSSQQGELTGERSLYQGRWIATIRQRIVGQGGTPEQALLAARAARPKEIPEVSYVPTSEPLIFSNLLQQIASALPENTQVYLVGGAVRDALINRPVHDLDFVMPGEVMRTAKQLAKKLKADFYPLDEERYTARLILTQPSGEKLFLDFAAMRGPDLESDLRARDFTINAMAVDIRQHNELLDPLGGLTDLRSRTLRACSATSISDDPVRILRAVRQAAAYRFHIVPETREQMRQGSALLGRVSPERIRDELFRIFEGPQPAAAMRALDLLGVLAHVLPELAATKKIEQSSPHVSDVWGHSLDAVQKLDAVFDALHPFYDPDHASNLALGLLVLHLGRFRHQIGQHLSEQVNPGRSTRSLLVFAILYHDVGKPDTQSRDEQYRIRFFQHEQVGADLMEARARALRLSNDEIDRLKKIVNNHLRPILLGQSDNMPSRKAIYRFFRSTGQAGVDVCLVSLADMLATYQSTLTTPPWVKHLEVVRTLLEAWWESPEQSVFPPAVVSGSDLMHALKIQPGPSVGRLLEAVREAQATGKVSNAKQALEYSKNLLEQWENEESGETGSTGKDQG